MNILRGEPNLCSAASLFNYRLSGKKTFPIISFKLHDANFQRTEFIESILNLVSSLQVLQPIQNRLLEEKNFWIISFQLHDANFRRQYSSHRHVF